MGATWTGFKTSIQLNKHREQATYNPIDWPMLRCDNLIALAIICNFFSPMLYVSWCIQSRTLNIPTDVFSMVKLNTSISTIDHYLFRRLITERVVTHSTSSVTADEIISLFTALSSRKPKVWPTWWSARGRRNYRSSPRTNPRERKREGERGRASS